MFNENGSHAVSTNHLASEAGVSIGNLYYHFRDKREIVRALFDRLDAAWRTRLVVPDPERVTFRDIEALVGEHFRVLWEYRFFYREQTSLRNLDAALARRWRAAHARGRSDMTALVRAHLATIAPGRPARPNEIERLADACWLIADYWMLYAESRSGPLRGTDLREGVQFFRWMLQPLLAAVVPESATERANRRRDADAHPA